MALTPGVLRPRLTATNDRRTSQVASGPTRDEFHGWQSAWTRESADAEGRSFVNDVTLPFSRNPLLQAAHSMEGGGFLLRTSQAFDAVGTPYGPKPGVNTLGTYDMLQKQTRLRTGLVQGTGRKRDSGDVNRLKNPRTEDDPSESRPWSVASFGFKRKGRPVLISGRSHWTITPCRPPGVHPPYPRTPC